MKKTYTPGPWYVVADDGADFTAIAASSHEGECDKEIMFDDEVLGSSEWLRVTPEDLRLMAMAPELLKACESALEVLNLYAPGYDLLLEQLECAIKKAKGE